METGYITCLSFGCLLLWIRLLYYFAVEPHMGPFLRAIGLMR